MHARRLLTILAIGVAVGVLLAFLTVYLKARGFAPDDTLTYLAAGERLNAGHPLYALSPGDRPVVLYPPYWTVPLVSPPPIAVLWRPLAALPNELGVWVWWVAQVVALGASLVMLARRIPLATAVAMLVLTIPMVDEIGMGNVNAFLVLGLILSWRFGRSDREPVAGVIAALMTAIKLTPGIVGWWLVVTGRRRAVVAAVLTAAGVLLISVLGAGISEHERYLRVLLDRSSVANSPGSLTGIARSLGIPDTVANVLPTAVAGIGVAGVLLLRRRPALSYLVAVLTMVFGSPAVAFNTYVLLLAALAPVAWPIRTLDGTPETLPEREGGMPSVIRG